MLHKIKVWYRRKFFDYSFWYLFGKESRKGAKSAFYKEMNGIIGSVNAYLDWTESESEIISDRLSHRFDLSTALNEAANRAIVEKKAIIEHQLTGSQQSALAFQKEYLQKIVRKA